MFLHFLYCLHTTGGYSSPLHRTCFCVQLMLVEKEQAWAHRSRSVWLPAYERGFCVQQNSTFFAAGRELWHIHILLMQMPWPQVRYHMEAECEASMLVSAPGLQELIEHENRSCIEEMCRYWVTTHLSHVRSCIKTLSGGSVCTSCGVLILQGKRYHECLAGSSSGSSGWHSLNNVVVVFPPPPNLHCTDPTLCQHCDSVLLLYPGSQGSCQPCAYLVSTVHESLLWPSREEEVLRN